MKEQLKRRSFAAEEKPFVGAFCTYKRDSARYDFAGFCRLGSTATALSFDERRIY
jgi:hypothetical protein